MKRFHQCRNSGFSLVELTLAVAIVASVLTSLMALVATSLTAARDSDTRTALGHIYSDVHERLEGQPLQEGPILNAPFFYDRNGRFIPSDAETEVLQSRIFRVDASLVPANADLVSEHADELFAVILDLHWPVDPDTGQIISERASQKSQLSYYVNALTSPGWEELDPDYVPAIQF